MFIFLKHYKVHIILFTFLKDSKVIRILFSFCKDSKVVNRIPITFLKILMSSHFSLKIRWSSTFASHFASKSTVSMNFFDCRWPPNFHECHSEKQLTSPIDYKSDNLQYNTLVRWVAGMNDSSTKRLKFQVLLFFHNFIKLFAKIVSIFFK